MRRKTIPYQIKSNARQKQQNNIGQRESVCRDKLAWIVGANHEFSARAARLVALVCVRNVFRHQGSTASGSGVAWLIEVWGWEKAFVFVVAASGFVLSGVVLLPRLQSAAPPGVKPKMEEHLYLISWESV